jgi:hypothetical protein
MATAFAAGQVAVERIVRSAPSTSQRLRAQPLSFAPAARNLAFVSRVPELRAQRAAAQVVQAGPDGQSWGEEE